LPEGTEEKTVRIVSRLRPEIRTPPPKNMKVLTTVPLSFFTTLTLKIKSAQIHCFSFSIRNSGAALSLKKP
jgi:hypothetical protein